MPQAPGGVRCVDTHSMVSYGLHVCMDYLGWLVWCSGVGCCGLSILSLKMSGKEELCTQHPTKQNVVSCRNHLVLDCEENINAARSSGTHSCLGQTNYLIPEQANNKNTQTPCVKNNKIFMHPRFEPKQLGFRVQSFAVWLHQLPSSRVHIRT